MLMPSNTKYRKVQKGNKGKLPAYAHSGVELDKGTYGLKATSSGRVTAAQIESARKVITRTLGKQCKIFIRIFPDRPVTKKPAEVRMGGGKGSPEYFVAMVSAGRILFEVEGSTTPLVKQAFLIAADKLPVSTKFISLEEKCQQI